MTTTHPLEIPPRTAPNRHHQTVTSIRALRDQTTTLAKHLTSADRLILRYWVLAHLTLAVLVWSTAWATSGSKTHAPLIASLQHWDATLLQDIAAHGYFGSIPNQTAFFPGYPAALALVHLIVRSWIASELLLTFAAGTVALVALGRFAQNTRAPLYLLTAPAAIFLTVGYSETLFLAFAIPAWLAAQRGAWTTTGILAFAAAITRPNGLFLIAALALTAILHPNGPRTAALMRLTPALLAPAAYETYLILQTGHANSWMTAQQTGWHIHLTTPWTALHHTWRAAVANHQGAEYALLTQLELAAMAAGLIGTAILLWGHRWDEALYTGLTLTALACTTSYEGVPRALLLCFPLWTLLARAAQRRTWIGQTYIALSAPLAALTAVLYLAGFYAG
jgi:hypothetical protein